MVVPTLLGFGVATAFLTSEPWLTLTVVGIVYVSSIPLTIRSYFRLKRAFLTPRPKPPSRPAPSSRSPARPLYSGRGESVLAGMAALGPGATCALVARPGNRYSAGVASSPAAAALRRGTCTPTAVTTAANTMKPARA